MMPDKTFDLEPRLPLVELSEPHADFSQELINSAQAYCDLMSDVKQRVDALRLMLTVDFFSRLPGRVCLESCWLQLRLIIELIARACLVAHSGAPGVGSSRSRKQISADETMNMLAEVHVEFYPIAEYQLLDEQGGWTGTRIRSEGFITRKQLTRLYSECGNNLHIRSLKALQQGPAVLESADENFQKLSGALRGIVSLLEVHTIITIDPEIQFWVNMAPNEGGDPELKIVKAKLEPELATELKKQRAMARRHG